MSRTTEGERMTLSEAVQRGISRVRNPKWAYASDYIKITLVPKPDGTYGHGPWLRLYSPVQSMIKEPTPQTILFTAFNWNEDGWEEYVGTSNAAEQP